ncbi:hypothetical protein ACE6H2_005938 [Prunus campanulata]
MTVCYAEAGEEFVNLLFGFLTLPLGFIVKQMQDNSMKGCTGQLRRLTPMGIGCMDNIYGSVESFDSQLFPTEECRAMLLRPRNRTEFLLDNLKLKLDDCEPTRYFTCSNPRCRNFRSSLVFSYYQTVRCRRCKRLMDTETTLPVSVAEDGEVFVKGPAKFIISDDLQVMPPFTSTRSSLVKNLGFTGWNSIEELTVNVGVDEVSNLLLRSFVSKKPLSETLLKLDPIPIRNPNLSLDQLILTSVESLLLGDIMNEEEEEKIVVKLTISVSKDIVCYAEAGEDFANLLLSFLTVPLGFVVKHMRDASFKGEIFICSWYTTVQDLDEQCLKSNNHKKMLVSPNLLPGFGYKKEPSFGNRGSLVSAGLKSVEFIDPKSHHNKDDNALGFLKGPATFMITDSLNVSLISAILGLSILCKLNVPVTDIEVQVAQVGKKEVTLCLLVASFLGDSVLSDVC